MKGLDGKRGLYSEGNALQLPENAFYIYIFAARNVLDTLSNKALECALFSSIPLTTTLWSFVVAELPARLLISLTIFFRVL